MREGERESVYTVIYRCVIFHSTGAASAREWKAGRERERGDARVFSMNVNRMLLVIRGVTEGRGGIAGNSFSKSLADRV